MALRVSGAALFLLAATTLSGTAHATETTLVWAEVAEPSTVDPAKADVNQEMTVIRNVYDRLINFDLERPDHLLPSLATSWKQEGTKWTIKLRGEVKFHNGQSFSAQDVKATIERDLRLKQGQSYLFSDIQSVKVVSPSIIELNTKAPDVFLAGNLTRLEIMSAADIFAHAGDADQGDAYFRTHANGTGPYRMAGWQHGVEINLDRNNSWWGQFPAKPYDHVIDRFVTDGADRARGLEGGSYDLAAFVPRDEALRIGKRPGFHLVEGNNLWAWPAIYLNTKLAPTSNADYRDALTKIFDYNAMNQFYGGNAVTPTGPIPSWVPGSPEENMAPIKEDIDAAKAALARSRLKGGSTNMSCAVPSEFTEFSFAATVLQASAAEIGLNVTINQEPFVQAIQEAQHNKVNCFIIGNANLSPTDPTKFFEAHYMAGGFYNTANLSLPALNALIEKIPTVTDAARRYDMIKDASEMVVTSHAIIWTARPLTVVPVPNKIGGYRIDPAEYINVRFWELYQK